MNRRHRGVIYLLLFSLLLISTASCSESSDTEDEWDNWQDRNIAVVDQWAANASYRKIRTFAKDESVATANSDYIYVEVLETGSGTESPLFTDTCLVAYRGNYIPTASYPDGYVFDQSYRGDFDWTTIGATKFALNGASIDGFKTALMNMHVGDRWRVHIPYTLGYGTSDYSSSSGGSTIPGYSNLIFEMALVDYWHPGDKRPVFRAPKR